MFGGLRIAGKKPVLITANPVYLSDLKNQELEERSKV